MQFTSLRVVATVQAADYVEGSEWFPSALYLYDWCRIEGVFFHLLLSSSLVARIHFDFPLSFSLLWMRWWNLGWAIGVVTRVPLLESMVSWVISHSIGRIPISFISFCLFSVVVWSFLDSRKKTRIVGYRTKESNRYKLFLLSIFFRLFPVKRRLHSAWRIGYGTLPNQNLFLYYYFVCWLVYLYWKVHFPITKWHGFFPILPPWIAGSI